MKRFHVFEEEKVGHFRSAFIEAESEQKALEMFYSQAIPIEKGEQRYPVECKVTLTYEVHSPDYYTDEVLRALNIKD